ncbi:hypothetical protein B0H63DRAFT_808 [Podospora didyma]|uniref:Uncharacterized protein n=1 Tax=Podospora didyma TaxID=330526 RepID=A0AAE0P3Q0_9PEZI|nr:hypothetical protein B0H63DRAFT_808 [Podospora didyma]
MFEPPLHHTSFVLMRDWVNWRERRTNTAPPLPIHLPASATPPFPHPTLSADSSRLQRLDQILAPRDCQPRPPPLSIDSLSLIDFALLAFFLLTASFPIQRDIFSTLYGLPIQSSKKYLCSSVLGDASTHQQVGSTNHETKLLKACCRLRGSTYLPLRPYGTHPTLTGLSSPLSNGNSCKPLHILLLLLIGFESSCT